MNPFGTTIGREKAQRMYKSFFKIKQRSIEKIRSGLPDDEEAARYHSGLQDANNNCCFLDMSFVFDKTFLKPLLDKGDGIVIFLGTRDMTDSYSEIYNPDTKTNEKQFNDVDGRPTLLVFSYRYENADGLEKLQTTNDPQNLIVALDDDGLEHPGTGGGGGGTGVISVDAVNAGTSIPIPAELPDCIPVANIKPLIIL